MPPASDQEGAFRHRMISEDISRNISRNISGGISPDTSRGHIAGYFAERVTEIFAAHSAMAGESASFGSWL